MDLTREQFHAGRRRRFGQANPERMAVPLWEWMVRQGGGPWPLRDRFGLPDADGEGPIWCFSRMGQTRTNLPDGRTVCVGGEHEDFYDPDFCIYNDVVVLGPDETVTIYGYPREDFPPADFHTATLVGDQLILVGGLGYPEERRPGTTPVYRLDLTTFRIERIETSGEAPGWMFHHEAELDPDGGSLRVQGGEVLVLREGQETTRGAVEEYRLHLAEGRWERLTDRATWYQFEVRRCDGRLFFEDELLLPDEVFQIAGFPHEEVPDAERPYRRVRIEGVTVRFRKGGDALRVLVEGALPKDVLDRLIAGLVANVEAATGQPCRVLAL